MTNVKNSNLQLAKAVTHKVQVNIFRRQFLLPLLPLLKWGSTPECHREQQQRAVPVPSKETGAAANSFSQLLPATARRRLSRNYTLSSLGTAEFYNTLSTRMSQPNIWLLFCRTFSGDRNWEWQASLSHWYTAVQKSKFSIFVSVKTYVMFSTAKTTLITHHTTTVIKVTLPGNQSNDSNWWIFIPNPLLFPLALSVWLICPSNYYHIPFSLVRLLSGLKIKK